MILWANTLAAADVRSTFEWGRIQSPGDLFLPLLLLALLLGYVVLMYRRDGRELSPARRTLLIILRGALLVGLLLVYLEPQWRTERELVRNSQVHLLLDTSLSMGLSDEQSATGTSPSRAVLVERALASSDLLERLRAEHDVAIWTFDQDLRKVATLPKSTGAAPTSEQAQAETIDWPTVLDPVGTETRLGQSLRQLVNDERAAPVSAVLLVTDGGQNAGAGPAAAEELAADLKLPIYPIGIGSDRRPVNVRISDLQAPARAYPGDSYTVTAYIQAQGLEGQEITAELYSRPADHADADNQAEPRREGSQQVFLPADGQTLAIKFDITPQENGRRELELKLVAPADDLLPGDNVQQADVEVVDRKNKVLLIAGGPSREYQFVRNQLHRDRYVEVDVWLQTAQSGVAQDAHLVREEFPTSREELSAYDGIIAFDPDWTKLSPTQIEMLERWVAEDAGGLIVIAGPIHLPNWLQESDVAKLRDLYPVEFPERFAILDTPGSDLAKPTRLGLSRDAQQADFLWLGDSAAVSQQAWNAFPGVFSCYPTHTAKPGATVYAYYGDETGAGDAPIYWASHFYGAGRVFYEGSGEMWRLRGQDETHFEQFYTKLLRFVTQGRLLRGSQRGVLLVERDRYLLGQTIAVKAQLKDARLEPLDVPEVELEIVSPRGQLEMLKMLPDPSRPGTFLGQFTAREEGAYRLELLPGDAGPQRLSRRVQVRVPDLEREDPRRNDALLSELAQRTGGRYYIGFDAASGASGTPPLVDSLTDRTKTMILTGEPVRLWDNAWVMGALCGVLCTEWLLRRMFKLA
jgi:hypothetical protein